MSLRYSKKEIIKWNGVIKMVLNPIWLVFLPNEGKIRDTDAQRDNQVGTQLEDSYLEAKKSGLRSQTWWYPNLNF
jgi:hypothetical protein